MFARLLPGLWPRLIDRTFRISRPLGSTATPASSGFTATTGRSASERRLGTQCLRVLPVGRLPLATLEAYDPGRRIDARLLTFHARAADQAHAAFTPGTAWPVLGTPPGSSRENNQTPRFRCHLNYANDASTARTRPKSTGPGASGTSSWSPPDAIKRAFSLSLTTTVFRQRSTG